MGCKSGSRFNRKGEECKSVAERLPGIREGLGSTPAPRGNKGRVQVELSRERTHEVSRKLYPEGFPRNCQYAKGGGRTAAGREPTRETAEAERGHHTSQEAQAAESRAARQVSFG